MKQSDMVEKIKIRPLTEIPFIKKSVIIDAYDFTPEEIEYYKPIFQQKIKLIQEYRYKIWVQKNKEHRKKYNKKWSENNKEKRRASAARQRRKKGIRTREEIKEMNKIKKEIKWF
jgi:hypothetical protein